MAVAIGAVDTLLISRECDWKGNTETVLGFREYSVAPGSLSLRGVVLQSVPPLCLRSPNWPSRLNMSSGEAAM